MFFTRTALTLICTVFIFLYSCSVSKPGKNKEKKEEVTDMKIAPDSNREGLFLEKLLLRYPKYFDQVLKNREAWNVQVIYTQVDRTKTGMATLTPFKFNVDASRYFYPASTVKLPVTLLALQKLNELNIAGLDKHSTMITQAMEHGTTAAYNDPTATDGRPSIAQYIKKILMVSDNDAFNRLYEFLGQQYINDGLHKMGYADVQILHRLNISLTPEQNRETNMIRFMDTGSVLLYSQDVQKNKDKYPARNDLAGKGFYRGGQLINEPMNFSGKNRISLEDLNNILISLVFTEAVKPNQIFKLTDSDKQFIFKYMSQLPTESTSPPYSDDTAQYWPAYAKFLLFGSEKGKLPENIRIFNKTGDAYGNLLDIAYIVDHKNKIEFFLSAIIYCNNDGILNDDKYDYNTIGLPFMKHLGQVIYDYELTRPRKNIPDLSGFIFKYDK